MTRAYHAATTTYTCRHLLLMSCTVRCGFVMYTVHIHVQVCISIHMYIVLYTCWCVSTYKMIQNWCIAETATSHIFARVPP